ncbi:hypothetical protein ILYODFUR_015470 [Ilyodon furcidens]|uniref:Uncharacterized protein n=1 Tax=Ilyodon furcidens TaxID=33524 RepID=A0ABV0TJ69_9TELE
MTYYQSTHKRMVDINDLNPRIMTCMFMVGVCKLLTCADQEGVNLQLSYLLVLTRSAGSHFILCTHHRHGSHQTLSNHTNVSQIPHNSLKVLIMTDLAQGVITVIHLFHAFHALDDVTSQKSLLLLVRVVFVRND